MGQSNTVIQNRNKEMSLIGLFGEETFETFQKYMADATDFSFSIIDYRGMEIIPGYYQKCYKKYLSKTGEDPAGKMASAIAAAKAAITNTPYIYLCQCGLVKIAVPIIVNGQYLGAVICGNVCCADVRYIDPETNLPLINIDFPLEEEKAGKIELEDFPVISSEKINIFANLIFYVIQQICQKEDYAIRVGNEEHNQIHLSDMRRKNSELKNKIKSLEMANLKPEIYPQTLLNMLITTSNLAIVEDAKETQKLVETFSDILRYYLESDHDMVKLSREMKMVSDFLMILQLQFHSRVKVNINQAKETLDQRIPKLILFPLVEYIINFGVMEHDFTGTFFCNAESISGRCLITFRLEQKEGSVTSVGYLNDFGRVLDEKEFHDQLSVLNKRLYYEYGDDYKLSVDSNVIILDMPMRMKESLD